MDIEQMKKYKRYLIRDITEALDEFTENTGIAVTSVDIENIMRIASTPKYKVDVEVKL